MLQTLASQALSTFYGAITSMSSTARCSSTICTVPRFRHHLRISSKLAGHLCHLHQPPALLPYLFTADLYSYSHTQSLVSSLGAPKPPTSRLGPVVCVSSGSLHCIILPSACSKNLLAKRVTHLPHLCSTTPYYIQSPLLSFLQTILL